MASTSGRRTVLILTNKSGGAVAAGDVVVVDSTTDESFTTTTSASSQVPIGVAQEAIANNASGRVCTAGYVALVATNAAVTRGHYAFTHTVAKQATGSSTRAAGAFGVYLKSSATPSAWLFGIADGAGGAALGAWTDYTPTLTAVTTNPTLGSSTLTGRYKLLDSKTGIAQAILTVTTGGAWNAGSGEWKFSLPAGWTSAARAQVGSCHVLDSGTARFAGTAMVAGSGTVIWPIVIADSTGDRVLKHNNPVTWATGDTVELSVLIEIA